MKRIHLIVIIGIIWYCGESWCQDCSVSAVSVNFGSFDNAMSAPVFATGTVSVFCNLPATVKISLNAGQNSGNSFHPRKMVSDVNQMSYNLYTDTACTQVWGDRTGNTFTRIGAGNFIVYGKIPVQAANVGSYGDSVMVTIEW